MLRSTNYSQTNASIEPILVKDVRDALRLDDTSWDAQLNELIPIVRDMAQKQMGDVCLIDQTCIDYFDEFGDEMELHYSPVDSDAISSVSYTDTDGDSQTLATSVYELGLVNGMGILRLKYNQTWPSTRSHSDVITVIYTAGFGTSRSDVPQHIRTWMAMRAAYLWEHLDWPSQLDSLLSINRTVRAIA